MEPTLFTDKLKDLGRFEARFKGNLKSDMPEDVIFKVNAKNKDCPNCFTGPGRQLIIEQKQDYKHNSYWRIKCKFCKTFFKANHPIT